MKKKIIFATALLVSAGAYAFNAGVTANWPFSAPHVKEKDNMDAAYFSAGDIVYDQADNKYYGLKNTGVGSAWVELGGTAASNIVTTSDNVEWGIESAKVSASGVVSAESGDWIDGNGSVSDTSLFALTIKTGVFSSAPTCILTLVQSSGAAAYTIKHNSEPTTTSLSVRTGWTSATVDFTKSALPFHIICQGPR
jgi:hypothetical protein